MDQYTKGPWKWEINLATNSVHLYALDSMRNIVMGFKRYGMGSAAPMFNVDGFLKRCDELTEVEKGREHHADWHQLISHPDAQLIASAPELLEALRKAIGDLTSLQLLGSDVDTETIEKGLSAIAKATA